MTAFCKKKGAHVLLHKRHCFLKTKRRSTNGTPLLSSAIKLHYKRIFVNQITHNYSINKRDLIEYLGTHLGTHSLKWHYIDHDPEPSLLITSIPDTVRYRMSTYLTTQLAGYPDLLKARDVSAITGYGKTTVGNWLKEGRLRYTVVRRAMYISKFELIEYMCTDDYDSVCRKSLKHKELIKIIRDAKD